MFYRLSIFTLSLFVFANLAQAQGPTPSDNDVNRVARQLIDPAQAHLAVVGPYRSEKRFAGVLP